uniref:Uncharacterized protein n=1 Tax=Meloidogyne hapla TaxID=6305 RepID=A0A1I8BYC5_MELHA
MEFLAKERAIYKIIFIIDYVLAAFISPALGFPRLDNWPYYSPPSLSSSFQIPYASYRNSAFLYPTNTKQIDNFQKQQLATIADETESFNSERRKASDFIENNNRGSEDGIQRILKTVAEKLPKIAETMSRFGNKDNNPITSQVGEEITNIDKQQIMPTKDSILPYSLNKREYNINNNNNELKEQNQNPLSSSPLFSSFSKLLSAFNAGNNNNHNIISATTASSGVIDKSVDLSPELIYQQKRQIFKGEQQLPDDKGYIPHLTPPPELPSPSQQNPLNSFLQQFGISNLMPNEKTEKNDENKERQEKRQNKEENGDLIGSLMRGQLPQMPDWLSQFGFDSMLGQNINNNEQQQSGNALAQIFGKRDSKNGGGGGALSSFFGSGLDDAPRK